MFKQPRIPEYREKEETKTYLRSLALFLKDFCMDSWKATVSLQRAGKEENGGDAQTLAGMTLEELDAYFERLRLDREHPVGGAPYITLLPKEQDDPNEKWPWSTWELDAGGRFLLGAGETHPLGETGGSETHTLTEDELPEITGTLTAGVGSAGVSAGGYGAIRSAWGCFTPGGEREHGMPLLDYRQAYVSGTPSYYSAVFAIGGGQAHSVMPPYMTANIWRRVA